MNRTSRTDGPVLVEVKPSIRKQMSPPKTGERYVVLIAGGAADMYRMMREHLERFRQVDARYHWEKPKEFTKPIPADVDLVIIVVTHVGHGMQDLVISEARAKGVQYVFSSHKWAELSQRLDGIGMPRPSTTPAIPPPGSKLKPKVVAKDGPAPLRQRIVLTQPLKAVPQVPTVEDLKATDEIEEKRRREQEEAEFEREFQRLLQEEQEQRAKLPEAEIKTLPPLLPLPISCLFEANTDNLGVCRNCGNPKSHELHSEKSHEAARAHRAAKLTSLSGKRTQAVPVEAPAAPAPVPTEPSVDELVHALVKAMKRESIEEVTIKFSERGKASVSIVELVEKE